MDLEKKTATGFVVKGKGEGAFFVSMEHYKNAFKEKLGFSPYPGTLNLKTETSQTENLKNLKLVRVSGFKQKDKTFGGVDCYPAELNGIKGAVIVPDYTGHGRDIMEFIAPVHLRTELKLKNNDKVKVEFK